MNVKECYEAFGGDYAGCFARLGRDSFIEKLLKKFLADENMNALEAALKSGNIEAAFSAAHTLKGLALNLGFTKLAESSSSLTEILRAGSFDGAEAVFSAVKENYSAVVDAVSKLG